MLTIPWKKKISGRDWFALFVAMPEGGHKDKAKAGSKGCTRAASSKPALLPRGKLSGEDDDEVPMPRHPATKASEDVRGAKRRAGILVHYDGTRPKVRALTAALPCSVVPRASGIAAQGQRQHQQLGWQAGGARGQRNVGGCGTAGSDARPFGARASIAASRRLGERPSARASD